ncbi:unnamed protein product [Arctia plantaginis]|uniref:Uncharacterized protein n=1 Tax=Arctia plantaginis TaxID=874455 RepID=A0A8S1BMA5_ARCPL|nr:unnamed protein product [Arctia plantaginis]
MRVQISMVAESIQMVLLTLDRVTVLMDFEEKLRTVFAEQNMTHQQIKAVLQVIKSHGCFSSIHVDPRTIMKTPVYSTLPIVDVAGGEYLHLGVRHALVKCLSSTPASMHPVTPFEIDFSTDEASLDKVSKILMWPIQIRVANIPNSSPYIVGIIKGSTKPSNVSLFFQPFKDEMQELLDNGLEFQNENVLVRLRCFVADAPARSFSLGHRGHNSVQDAGKPSQHLQLVANRNAANCNTQSKIPVDPSRQKYIGKHLKGPTPPIDDNNYCQYSSPYGIAVFIDTWTG